MKVLLTVCALAFLCGVLAKSKKDDKVKIAVYYESLCPDSKKFITSQLAPVWRDLRGIVKVKLVPYGKSTISQRNWFEAEDPRKAHSCRFSDFGVVWVKRDARSKDGFPLERDKVNEKWQFNCHHGPDECYGNKVQACILKDRILQDTDKMELVICLMGQSNPDKSLDTCLEKLGKQSEGEKLKKCADGNQGNNLLASYGDKSDHLQRPLSFVPTVVVNEKFDQAIQDEAMTNLKAIICRVAPNKPTSCE